MYFCNFMKIRPCIQNMNFFRSRVETLFFLVVKLHIVSKHLCSNCENWQQNKISCNASHAIFNRIKNIKMRPGGGITSWVLNKNDFLVALYIVEMEIFIKESESVHIVCFVSFQFIPDLFSFFLLFPLHSEICLHDDDALHLYRIVSCFFFKLTSFFVRFQMTSIHEYICMWESPINCYKDLELLKNFQS